MRKEKRDRVWSERKRKREGLTRKMGEMRTVRSVGWKRKRK